MSSDILVGIVMLIIVGALIFIGLPNKAGVLAAITTYKLSFTGFNEGTGTAPHGLSLHWARVPFHNAGLSR